MIKTLDDLLSTAHPIGIQQQKSITQQGIQALVSEIENTAKLEPGTENVNVRIDRQLIDRYIARIDKCLSEQIDEILHHTVFQNLESAWRSLQRLTESTEADDNIKIDFIDISKDEFADELEDASEIQHSAFYQWLYTQEYAQFGGEPYAATIANYNFNHFGADLSTLKKAAGVSAMAHAPFIASASPHLLGLSNFGQLSQIKAVNELFDNPSYASWNSFRETEDARYLALTLPAYLQRRPYHPEHKPCRTLHYHENIESNTHYLWGNAAFALGSRMIKSFSQYRWCPNIIGAESGGTVEALPLHFFDSLGDLEVQISTETLISDRMEKELSEQGLIPLCFKKGSDKATFFSANSIQKPKQFNNSDIGQQDRINSRLGTQLPYLFVISRIAHYLKVIQREQLGSWKEAQDLERELNQWINQYVANQDHAPAEIRTRKPLREAKISVSENTQEPGWYHVSIHIRPHFKYMGSDIMLSLKGQLEAPEVSA